MTAGLDDALNELARRLQMTPAGLRFDNDELPGATAVDLLADRLHSSFFCRRTRPVPSGARASGDGGLVAHLATASRGAAGWEPGWRVVKAGSSWSFVSDGRLCLFLDEPGYFAPPEARVGDTVVVRVPRARENLTPHRFTLFGGAGPASTAEPFVKLFVPVTLEGAGPMVELLCSRCFERTPFTLYVTNAPDDFERLDTAVLDVPRREEEPVTRFLTDFARAHRGAARLGAPLFTRHVQAGVARSDGQGPLDAGDGFGRRRCRALAQQLWAGLQAGERNPAAWRARITSGMTV
jgi:hypothetical protein